MPDLDEGVVALGSDQVYVLETDGRLTAYALADGSERWVFEPDELGAAGLGVADDAVYCSMQTSVFALDTDGAERWQHEGVTGALAVDDERVYADDDTLVALERE